MIHTVFEFRKEFDSLKASERNMTNRLDKFSKEFQLLTKSAALSEESDSGDNDKLKGLKMQLNTVTIKIAETSENRQNYETNINHLKVLLPPLLFFSITFAIFLVWCGSDVK